MRLQRMLQAILAVVGALLLTTSCEQEGSDASATTGTGGAAGGAILAPDGSPCDDAGACASGYCADGVCCATACDGTCDGCALSGSEGTCSPAPAGTDSSGECGGGSCDGAGSCIGAVHVWSRAFPGAWFHRVVTLSDGSIVMAGELRNNTNLGGDDLVPSGNRDVLLARFTADGDHVWSKRFGVAGNLDVALALAIDATGHIWVTGTVAGPVDFGGGPRGSAVNENDVFVLKLDAMGNHVWSGVFGDIGESDEGHDIVVTADAVYVVGIHDYYVNFGGAALLGPGFFLAKLDPSGGHVWSDSFGLWKGDTVTPVKARLAAAPGGVVMTGTFAGTVNLGGDDLTSQTSVDTFLASLDVDGNHLWSNSFTVDRAELAVSPQSRIYLTGFFYGNADLGTGVLRGGASAASSMYIAAFDLSGQALWSQRFGDSRSDTEGTNYGASISVDENGTVTITGGVEGTTDFGGGGLRAAAADAFVARFNQEHTHLFSANYGDPDSQEGRGLALTSNGFFVVGECNGVIDLGGGPLDCASPNGNFFVARFASAP